MKSARIHSVYFYKSGDLILIQSNGPNPFPLKRIKKKKAVTTALASKKKTKKTS